jgi:hypothetical protein
MYQPYSTGIGSSENTIQQQRATSSRVNSCCADKGSRAGNETRGEKDGTREAEAKWRAYGARKEVDKDRTTNSPRVRAKGEQDRRQRSASQCEGSGERPHVRNRGQLLHPLGGKVFCSGCREFHRRKGTSRLEAETAD